MLLKELNRRSDEPLFIQIRDQIRGMIDEGVLPPDSIIPSTRSLAEKLGVNRTTVYRAYEELWALGYIESRPGSVTRVRVDNRGLHRKESLPEAVIDWSSLVTSASEELYTDFQGYHPEIGGSGDREIINFSSLGMDPRLFPVDDFRRSMNHALLSSDRSIYGYGERAGYRPLRQYIVRRLGMYGITLDEENILITNGSQHGIELLLKLFITPGTPVIIESPTYANILPLLRFYGAVLHSIPMHQDGMDLTILEETLVRVKPAFIYTIPNFHNPTGITTDHVHRERLLSLCEHYGVPLVEDGFEEEMKYYGKVALPVKSMDRSQVVIYLGTFSKILMPGLRIGWIAADKDCIHRLLSIKRFCDLTSSAVLQAVLAEFCSSGYYDLHVRRMHRIYRKRMGVALSAMNRYLPEDRLDWYEPNGGYLVWCWIKDGFTLPEDYTERLMEYGVSVSPGEFYFDKTPKKQYFRLSVSNLDEDQLERGFKALGAALREFCARE